MSVELADETVESLTADTADTGTDLDIAAVMDEVRNEDAPAPAPEADAPADTEEAPHAEAAETPAEAPEEAPDDATLEPFTFNAFRQAYEVPGLAFDKARHAIVAETPQALDRLRQMLSLGREWEARGRQELVQLRQELKRVQDTPNAEIEQARVFMEQMRHFMTAPEEELAEFILNARTEWPKLEAKAERAYAERLMEQARQATQPPEPDVELVVDEARQGASALVQELLQDQPWANPEIAAELAEYLQDVRTLDQWVMRATRDLPEMGIRAGQYVANWDAARELADRMLKPYRRAFEQTATVQQRAAQTTRIAAQNANALATAKKPMGTPAKAPPAAPRRDVAMSGTRSQSRAELMSEVWAVWKDQQRAR